MQRDRLITAEEFERMPDDGKFYELVRGRLVVMSQPDPRHGELMTWISYLLFSHVERHGLGRVISGDPGCVLERGPDTVRGPDVAFVSRARAGTGPMPNHYLEGSPDLVVEILSKNDRTRDVRDKALEYLAAGATRVWVVDDRRAEVTVYSADGVCVTLNRDGTLEDAELLPGFRVTVAALLRKG